MKLTCAQALAYLFDVDCHRVAGRLAAGLPGIEPKDLLQIAAVNLTRTLRNRCPAWDDCPARGGARRSPCTVPPGDEDDHGEMYVKRALRNVARDQSQTTGTWSARFKGHLPGVPGFGGVGGSGGDEAEHDADKSSLLAGTDPPVADAVQRQLHLARLRGDVERLAHGEAPEAIWPGVTAVRIVTKVEAAALVLGGSVDDVGDALRLVDPAHYGDPYTTRALPHVQRKRASRDGAQIRVICRSVWRRENDG